MHVLVATATRHGATGEIGEAIAAALRTYGVDAESRLMRDVSDVAVYDAVVLGSAIYMGKWLPSASAFIDVHAPALARLPTWLFSSGPLGDPPKPDEAHAVVDVDDLVERAHARAHRVFLGKLDRHDLDFGERALAWIVRAPAGDFRDWDAIDAWAGTIAHTLVTVPALTVPT
jgi:menaquinone-dependent protoporphyrinogen oxidase